MTDRSFCVGCDRLDMCSLEPLSRHCALKFKMKAQQPQTNGDRLRAMSDEQLALAISMTANCDLCPIKNCKARHYSSPDNCERHWLQWLRSPANRSDEDA